jgi:hypothetical protein
MHATLENKRKATTELQEVYALKRKNRVEEGGP